MTENTAGFTLIEGMVAAVILATGLLAISGMQAISLTRNVDANEMTRVTNLAADMVERIQFNRANARFYDGIDTNSACSVDANAQPMARGDCDQWRNLLTGTFGSGLTGVRGQVTVTPNSATTPLLNARTVAVTISWTSDAAANTPARARQVTLTTVVAPE